jgi:hypothetical protein
MAGGKDFTSIHITYYGLLLIMAVLSVACSRTDHSIVNQRYTKVLISKISYKNPYSDVTLKVTFNGPGNRLINGFGYWDGSDTFKIRCFFPEKGEWTWKTICSDTLNKDLHNQTGTVQVNDYSGDNKLYKEGYLRVSNNKKYLAYGDGKPFFWLGETVWAAISNATDLEWKRYVDDRAAQGFTVFQVYCAKKWGGDYNVKNQKPFLKDSLKEWNPAYWRTYEDRVEYANSKGLVVAIIGVMEPVYEMPRLEDAKCFARNLVARMMGNYVIFSPSFDTYYVPLGDSIGKLIKNSTSVHLVTQHPCTELKANLSYCNKSYNDFAGLQSGAGWVPHQPVNIDTAAKTAVDWSLRLKNAIKDKPFINLESRYDSELNQEQLPRMPRSCGYWTILSGATGYTYGCAGLWNWGLGKMDDDPQASNWTYQKAINAPSANQMTLMSNFFNKIEWWQLKPDTTIVISQPAEWHNHLVAATTDNQTIVLYIPNNNSAIIKCPANQIYHTLEWYNPLTGENISEKIEVNKGNRIKIFKPAGWDDALAVIRK